MQAAELDIMDKELFEFVLDGVANGFGAHKLDGTLDANLRNLPTCRSDDIAITNPIAPSILFSGRSL